LNYIVRPTSFAHARLWPYRAPAVLLPCSYRVSMKRFNLSYNGPEISDSLEVCVYRSAALLLTKAQ